MWAILISVKKSVLVFKDYSRSCDNHNPVFYRKLIIFCLSIRSLFLQNRNVYIEITIVEKYVRTDYFYCPPPHIYSYSLCYKHTPLHICTYIYVFELRENLEHFCSQNIFMFKPHKKLFWNCDVICHLNCFVYYHGVFKSEANPSSRDFKQQLIQT